jgi:hypothetical protein
MSREGPAAKANLKRDDEHLPLHIVVMITCVFLLVLGGGAAIVYFSVFKPPVVPQPTATPLVQSTVTVKATPHASPTPRPSPRPTNSPTPRPSPTPAGSPTVGTQPNPYPPRTGGLVLSDPLKDNSKGHQWNVGTFANGSSCAFTGGSYHAAVAVKGHVFACNAANVNFANFACEVQMTILKGDRGGLFFRRNGAQGPSYYYSIKTDGSYELDSVNGSTTHILQRGSSSVIKKGLNQTNLIAVVAQGSSITLYVNRQSIAHAGDSSLSHGLIALAADATDQPAEVAFANTNVWAL